jgi:glucose-6-phosphate isomerase
MIEQPTCSLSLAQLFQQDPTRGHRYAGQVGDLYVNYAKHWVTDDTLQALTQFAQKQHLPEAIQKLFSGAVVNVSEQLPALHTALRAQHPAQDTIRAAHASLVQGVEALYQGDWRGSTGKPFRSIIHLGIGGSDVGPRLAIEALAAYRHPKAPRIYFVSNMDGLEWQAAIKACSPSETLVILASKSFQTPETLLNAETARAWFVDHHLDPAAHWLAITAHPDRAKAFGVERILWVGPWIGGRYSLWSTMGFSVAAFVGVAGFEALLAGAEAVDIHFAHTPLPNNLPALLGLLTVWYRNEHDIRSHVILPYTQALALLPTYLQQLDMESCGKSCTQDGKPVSYSGMAVWGQVGTLAQHTFHQWLHQGTETVLTDFILVAEGHPLGHQHTVLANALAQSQALMAGCPNTDLHRHIPGNRPHTILVLPRLSPYTLGNLLAFYEHQVYTQAVGWGINPFDQFGVELGKKLTSVLLPVLEGGSIPTTLDSATSAVIAHLKNI